MLFLVPRDHCFKLHWWYSNLTSW